MEKLYPKLTARRATLKHACAHSLAALLLALFASALVAAQVRTPA
ncbi:MAG: hypothetical protein ACJ74Q_21085 [Pyrinomonadaceae bacterium]